MKRAAWGILFLPVVLGVLGGLSNAIVCIINHGQMPVYIPGGCPGELDWNHACMTAHSHLKILADWMVTNGGISSLGDLALDISRSLMLPSILTWAGLTLLGLKGK